MQKQESNNETTHLTADRLFSLLRVLIARSPICRDGIGCHFCDSFAVVTRDDDKPFEYDAFGYALPDQKAVIRATRGHRTDCPWWIASTLIKGDR